MTPKPNLTLRIEREFDNVYAVNIKETGEDLHLFHLTEQHLKLLPHLSILAVGQSGYDWLAPAIGHRRPYGNSNVIGDIAEHLGIEGKKIDEDEYEFTPDQIQTMIQIHNGISPALTICLQTFSFQPGLYLRPHGFFGRWIYVSGLEDEKLVEFLQNLYIFATTRDLKPGQIQTYFITHPMTIGVGESD